jgi:hypothetical protein
MHAYQVHIVELHLEALASLSSKNNALVFTGNARAELIGAITAICWKRLMVV